MEITYKHKTNIKLITAVAIDTNTCYLTVAGFKTKNYEK